VKEKRRKGGGKGKRVDVASGKKFGGGVEMGGKDKRSGRFYCGERFSKPEGGGEKTVFSRGFSKHEFKEGKKTTRGSEGGR